MKKYFAYTLMGVLICVLNFIIYNYSFNTQATPFLTEEQRVESGLMMLQTTVPAYIVSSVIITLLFSLLAKKLND